MKILKSILKGLFLLFALGVCWLAFPHLVQSYIDHQRTAYREQVRPTASPQVQVLEDSLYIDYLDTTRTIRVYLPRSYQATDRRYPVVYLMDAHAIFDDEVLGGPEWQVDEVMDSLDASGGAAAIVIGIDDALNRNPEYMPFLSPYVSEVTSVTGKAHAEWIATDLKAWVDSSYRTLPDPQHTVVGGASLSGLMAYYLLMTYPETFHQAIAMSPSFWVNDSVFSLHEQVPDLGPLKLYVNHGAFEHDIMAERAEKMLATLQQAGMKQRQIRYEVEPWQAHWHPTWRAGFRKAYLWLSESWGQDSSLQE